ncbi:hypothetical protein Tco_1062675, partial [Tanacetum coccineum]
MAQQQPPLPPSPAFNSFPIDKPFACLELCKRAKFFDEWKESHTHNYLTHKKQLGTTHAQCEVTCVVKSRVVIDSIV